MNVPASPQGDGDPGTETCVWQEDQDGYVDAPCSKHFFDSDEVAEFRFCPYCGKKLIEQPYQEEA